MPVRVPTHQRARSLPTSLGSVRPLAQGRVRCGSRTICARRSGGTTPSSPACARRLRHRCRGRDRPLRDCCSHGPFAGWRQCASGAGRRLVWRDRATWSPDWCSSSKLCNEHAWPRGPLSHPMRLWPATLVHVRTIELWRWRLRNCATAQLAGQGHHCSICDEQGGGLAAHRPKFWQSGYAAFHWTQALSLHAHAEPVLIWRPARLSQPRGLARLRAQLLSEDSARSFQGPRSRVRR